MARRYPTEARVGAQRYKIRMVRNLASLGEFDMDEGEIRLRSGMNALATATTLLHELLHAIADTMGGNLNEEQVRCIEQGLGILIQDNPVLVERLIEDIASGP